MNPDLFTARLKMLTELLEVVQHHQRNQEKLWALKQQVREINDLIADCQILLDKHRHILGPARVSDFLGEEVVNTARRLREEIEKELQR